MPAVVLLTLFPVPSSVCRYSRVVLAHYLEIRPYQMTFGTWVVPESSVSTNAGILNVGSAVPYVAASLPWCSQWQMFIFIYISKLSPLLCFPSANPRSYPPPPCFYEGALTPTHSCLTALAFPYTGALILHRTKSLSSHWCPTRLSSGSYASGAMSPSMCTFWSVV